MKSIFEVDSNGQATRVSHIIAVDIAAGVFSPENLGHATITADMVREWGKMQLQVAPETPQTIVINIVGCGGCKCRGECVPMVPPAFPPREQWQPPGIVYC